MAQGTGKLEMLVRVGFFSRAILYMVLGLIALGAIGQISQGTAGIFKTVDSIPGGNALLWVLVIGMVGYAMFRFASPAFDIENKGSDAKGWAQRIGHAGSGIGHLALAWTAYKFATGAPGREGNGAAEAAQGVLSFDLGGPVIGILGITFFLAALSQAMEAATASFMHNISSRAPEQTELVGRIGYATRAVIFAIIGWSLVQTGFLAADASNVKTLGEAVASLAAMGTLFTLVAIGLIMFGLFSLLLARYRIIPDIDEHARKHVNAG